MSSRRFHILSLTGAKLRPVLLLKKTSERHGDWLVCMVTSQIQQAEVNLDEQIGSTDADFADSGLKATSILRLSRLAVLANELMVGSIGAISDDRLSKVRQRLSDWIRKD